MNNMWLVKTSTSSRVSCSKVNISRASSKYREEEDVSTTPWAWVRPDPSHHAPLILLLPLSAEAQFGPIIPEACRTCACGFAGVLAIIQNVVNFMIAIAIMFATIIMVWAGGLYVLSATNPESRSTANKMLINAAVGLLIVLSAWLIVDFVMKTLYKNDSEFGPWNSILVGGDNSCIVAKATSPLFSGDMFTAPGQGTGASGGGSCTPIPDSQLVTFDPSATDGQTRKGTADTVQRFMNMRAAASRDGITLKAGNAYRSPQEAEDLWRSHGCQVVNGKTVCSNGSEVAKPCSVQGGGGSNHTKGTAIDIETNAAGTAWLRRNAAQYGFYNRIAAEPWHWSDSGY